MKKLLLYSLTLVGMLVSSTQSSVAQGTVNIVTFTKKMVLNIKQAQVFLLLIIMMVKLVKNIHQLPVSKNLLLMVLNMLMVGKYKVVVLVVLQPPIKLC